MRIFVGLIYAVLLFILFIFEYKKRKDLFHPLVFFVALQLLKYPYAIIYKEQEAYAYFNDSNVMHLVFCNLLYTSFFFLSFLFLEKSQFWKKRKIEYQKREVTTARIFLFFLIGAGAKIYSLIRIGGISAILFNPSIAYSAQASGFGYLTEDYYNYLGGKVDLNKMEKMI